MIAYVYFILCTRKYVFSFLGIRKCASELSIEKPSPQMSCKSSKENGSDTVGHGNNRASL